MKMTIGKSFDYGFAGNYAKQPDMIVRSLPVSADSEPIIFGNATMLDLDGTVKKADSTLTADTFLGIATSEVKSQISITNSEGQYLPEDAASIMVRGIINVIVSDGGSPKVGDPVYVQIGADDNVATFAAASGTDTLLIPNLVFMTGKDSNNVASVQMRTVNLV